MVILSVKASVCATVVAFSLSVLAAGGALAEAEPCEAFTLTSVSGETSPAISDAAEPAFIAPSECPGAENNGSSRQLSAITVDSAHVLASLEPAFRNVDRAVTALHDLHAGDGPFLAAPDDATVPASRPSGPAKRFTSAGAVDISVSMADVAAFSNADAAMQQISQSAADAMEAATRSVDSALASVE